jgi:hypothetical protein
MAQKQLERKLADLKGAKNVLEDEIEDLKLDSSDIADDSSQTRTLEERITSLQNP